MEIETVLYFAPYLGKVSLEKELLHLNGIFLVKYRLSKSMNNCFLRAEACLPPSGCRFPHALSGRVLQFLLGSAPASLAALLILPVTASGPQILTVLERDAPVARPFLLRRHLTKETICFNETGSHSETPFFFSVPGRGS